MQSKNHLLEQKAAELVQAGEMEIQDQTAQDLVLTELTLI
jgi:hypothetical protein